MKRNAFTLIELLVVIAIIAVLAAIAIPVYGSAMERARATQDGSNLHQLGIGVQAYLNDHNDDMFTRTSAAGTWPRAMHDKYVTDWKSYHSPFDRVPASRMVEAGGADSAPVSYGLNTQLFDVSSSDFESASELIMMAPVYQAGPPIRFSGTSGQNVDLPVGGNGGTRGGTHGGRLRINAVFADAHVSDMLYAEFVKSSGDQRRRWYPKQN